LVRSSTGIIPGLEHPAKCLKKIAGLEILSAKLPVKHDWGTCKAGGLGDDTCHSSYDTIKPMNDLGPNTWYCGTTVVRGGGL